MAITISTTVKYSLKYTASRDTYDTAARSLSGLNVNEGASVADKGPNPGTALGKFIPTLQGFSNSSLTDFRWLTEKEVTF